MKYYYGQKLPEDFEAEKADARESVGSLGNLPLAISQSSAFDTEKSTGVYGYLEAFTLAVSEVQDPKF